MTLLEVETVGICDGRSDSGTVFTPTAAVFLWVSFYQRSRIICLHAALTRTKS